jgi:hypothetical protein
MLEAILALLLMTSSGMINSSYEQDSATARPEPVIIIVD